MWRWIALGLSIFVSFACTKKEQTPPPVSDTAAAHIAKLKDGSESERITAMQALVEIGAQAKSAVPELERAIEDNEEAIRREAVRTMQAIAPENAAGRSGQIRLRLQQIGVAMHDHIAANKGALPPTCTIAYLKDREHLPRLGLSWRVLLLPYLNQKDLFAQFKLDEPWDSEHNRKLIVKMPAVYASPAGSPGEANPGETHMQVFTHVTPFGFAQGSSPFAYSANIAFQKLPPCRIQDIVDGSSNTFLVVEAAKPVIWTKPEDVKVSDTPLPELGHTVDGVFHVCMADGSVRQFSRRASTFDIRVAIGRADGFVNNFDGMSPSAVPPAPQEVAPVLGRVLVKGVPLTTGWVVLHDRYGREYGGPLGVDGSFLVSAVPIGKVQATIAQGDPFAAWLANPDAKFKFPRQFPVQARFMVREQSGLRIDVKPNAKEITLELD